MHNHPSNDELFQMYNTSSEIDDPVLRSETVANLEVGGNARHVRERVSVKSGTTFTRVKYNKFKSYHLGGGLAAVNLDALVSALADQKGACCVTIHDQNDVVVGIVTQAGVQRELFKRYGDSLTMDWTHNTNNLGFNLGSLLVTSATGKGVPVVEFLTLTQDMSMMKTVLDFFVKNNPRAAAVKSFVIDKDYKEWRVLQDLFPGATVVLCQFHVLKWFKRVVTKKRYEIPVPLRKSLLKLMRSLVYAEDREAFERGKARIDALLADDKYSVFKGYMADRWYSCIGMWANHERGRIFTAGNTTTNRIESHWGHLKAGLGRKRRIDRCLKAILLRELAVLRRELDELLEVSTKTKVLEHDHGFVRMVLRRLSTSRAKLVRAQWQKYISRARSYTIKRRAASSVYSVRASQFSDTSFDVDVGAWTCSCRFSSSHHLPCRHQLLVGHKELKLSEFPIASLPARWDVVANTDLVPILKDAIAELAVVRVTNLAGTGAGRDDNVRAFRVRVANGSCVAATAPASAPAEDTSSARPSRVEYVPLRRRMEGDLVVLSALEKRNFVKSQCDRFVRRLMDVGTRRFKEMTTKLETVFDEFLRDVDEPIRPDADDVGGADATVSQQTTVDDSAGSPPDNAAMTVPEEDVDDDDEVRSTGGDSDVDLDDVGDGDEDDFDNGFDYEPDEEGADDSGDFMQPEYAFDSLDLRHMYDSQVSSLQLTQPSQASSFGPTQMSQSEMIPFPGDLPSPLQSESTSAVRFPLKSPRTTAMAVDVFLQGEVDMGFSGVDSALAVVGVFGRFQSTPPERRTPSETVRDGGLENATHERDRTVDALEDNSVDDHPVACGSPEPVEPVVLPALSSARLPDTPSRKTRQAKRRIGYDEELMRATKRTRSALDTMTSATPFTTAASLDVFDQGISSQAGQRAVLKLPPVRKGTTRNNKQVARPGPALAIREVDPTICPLSTTAFGVLLLHAPLGDVFDMLSAFETRDVDAKVATRRVYVSERAVGYDADGIKYVLPSSLVERMLAAIASQRDKDEKRDHEVEASGSVQYFARMVGLPDEINESTLLSMDAYYDVAKYKKNVTADLSWIADARSWESTHPISVPYMDDLAEKCALEVDGDASQLAKMSGRVEKRYRELPLREVLIAPSDEKWRHRGNATHHWEAGEPRLAERRCHRRFACRARVVI